MFTSSISERGCTPAHTKENLVSLTPASSTTMLPVLTELLDGGLDLLVFTLLLGSGVVSGLLGSSLGSYTAKKESQNGLQPTNYARESESHLPFPPSWVPFPNLAASLARASWTS